MVFGSEIGERISLSVGAHYGADGRSHRRTTADPGQLCRCGPPNNAARYPAIDDIVTTLPKGCTTVVIEGTTLQQCVVSCYEPCNNQYVTVVYVD